MNYIENVYICLAAPVIIAVVCSRAQARRMLSFVLSGMTVCLFSSYISTFVAYVQGADPLMASLTIAPPVEEFLKLLPFLFYLTVFEPGKENVSGCILMTSVGFATFENVCYLTQNGARSLFHLLIRGFGTGTMHVICGAIMSVGLMILWDRMWLRIAGSVGLLTLAITYHGIYNILVSQAGAAAYIGYFIPVATTILGMIIGRNRFSRPPEGSVPE